MEEFSLDRMDEELRGLQAKREILQQWASAWAKKVHKGEATTGNSFRDWAFMHYNLGYQPQYEKLQQLVDLFGKHVGELVMIRETHKQDLTPEVRYAHAADHEKNLIPPHRHINTSFVTRYAMLSDPGLQVVPFDEVANDWKDGALFDERFAYDPLKEAKPPLIVPSLAHNAFLETQRSEFGQVLPASFVIAGAPTFIDGGMFATNLSVTDDGYQLPLKSQWLLIGGDDYHSPRRNGLFSIEVVLGDGPVRKRLFEDTKKDAAFHAQNLDDIAALYAKD